MHDLQWDLSITQHLILSDEHVLLQSLLIMRLLRSPACAAQCSCAAHMLRWLLQLQDDAAVVVCIAAGRVE